MRYIGRILSVSSHRPLGTIEYEIADGSETFKHTLKFYNVDCVNFRPQAGMEVSFELAPFRALNIKELKGHGQVFMVNFERQGGKA